MGVATNALKMAALAQAAALLGVVNGSKLILFTNAVAITPRTVLADLIQPEFAGYVPTTVVVWGAPFLIDDNTAMIVGQHKQFQPTDALVETFITGWGLVDTTGLVLQYAELLETGVVLNDPTQAVIVEPRLPSVF